MIDTASVLSRYEPGEDHFPAWCYARPDGTLATCFGNSKALLRFDGNLIGTKPWQYGESRKEGWHRVPSGKAIDDIFTQKINAVELPATVEEWLALEGERMVPKQSRVECGECGGTGQVECPHCEQDMDCEECDGTGQVDGIEDPPRRYVLVNGATWFDVRIVCNLLRLVGSGAMTVHLANSTKPSMFVGDGWEMIAMPLSRVEDNEEVQRLYYPATSDPSCQPQEGDK